MKRDQATRKREKLQYARILVEVHMNEKFPDKIAFVNEHECNVRVLVVYEWKHVLCENGKGLGHETLECRIKKVKKVWQQKIVQPPRQEEIKQKEVHTGEQTSNVKSPEAVDSDGFQKALKPIRVRVSQRKDTTVINTFHVLNEKEDGGHNGEHEAEVDVAEMVQGKVERGTSLNPNG